MENQTNKKKTLAVDFGEKRVGLAISDINGKIAAPLGILQRKTDATLIHQIKEVADKNNIDRILVGIPKTDPEHPSKQELRTISFLKKLQSNTKVLIIAWDEAYSTQAVTTGRRMLDAKAAASFLQEFLDTQNK